MHGWLILLALLGGIGYMIYNDETRPVEVKQAQEQRRKDRVVGELDERCVNGILYYFTDGAHNVRFAPAIDADTLTYKRCR